MMRRLLVCLLVSAGAPAWAAGSAKISVAVMDLKASKSVPADVASMLAAGMTQELDRLGPFKAISNEDINHMINFEKTRDQLGCDSVSCMSEIGGALGVDKLVVGSITAVGESYIVQLQLTNTREARVESRVEREYTGPIKGLLADVRVAVRILVRDTLAAESGRLTIKASEEGASVEIDGSIVGSSPLPTQTLGSGTHALAVKKEGFVVWRRDVEVAPQQEAIVEATLLPSTEYIDAYERRAGGMRAAAWGTTAGGVAAIAGGLVLYNFSGKLADDVAAETRAYNSDSVRSSATFADIKAKEREVGTYDVLCTVATGVGVAALATGIILFATGDSPSRYAHLRVAVGQATRDTGDPDWRVVLMPQGLSLQARY